MTTTNQVREGPAGSSNPGTMAYRETDDIAGHTILVQHQVSAENGTDRLPPPPDLASPPPAPAPVAAAADPMISVADSSRIFSTEPSSVPLLASVPATRENSTGPARSNLSSIARNHQANRVFPNPPSGLGGATTGNTGSPFDSFLGNMSPTLRNRLEGSTGSGEEPQFDYPDIHGDPAKRYHDRYGAKEDHDPFVFPWVMNLIFEDRWLLDEKDPDKALKNQLQRRMKIDIRDPDPDTANFPNGAYTLPKGRLYIENSPLGLYSASSSGSQPRIYQWEYLIRYGLTDNLEFRVFSNGLSDQAAQGPHPSVVGYQPLALDFKANFWEENTKYHVPAMGVEIYLQTKLLGSSAFNTGTQPSINLLFDQSLPLGVGFEYNFGYNGVQNNAGQIAYQFSYQWSLQREVVKDFDVFFHGFYNAAALPRLSQFQSASMAAIPNVTVLGFGGIRTINDRLSVFGSYNFGVTPDAPTNFALLGFALAL